VSTLSYVAIILVALIVIVCLGRIKNKVRSMVLRILLVIGTVVCITTGTYKDILPTKATVDKLVAKGTEIKQEIQTEGILTDEVREKVDDYNNLIDKVQSARESTLVSGFVNIFCSSEDMTDFDFRSLKIDISDK